MLSHPWARYDIKLGWFPSLFVNFSEPVFSPNQNVTFKRAIAINAISQGSLLGNYLHNNGSYGAIVCLAPKDANGTLPLPNSAAALADKIAQHVVALDPDTLATLASQPFVFDGSRNVGAIIEQESKALGVPARIAAFVRWGGGKEVLAVQQ